MEDKFNKRRTKRNIKSLASRLVPNVSYAWGCRGHPGLVIERSYRPGWSLQELLGASVIIKSLVDGVEESCSIHHCSPSPLSKEEAEHWAEKLRTTNSFDITVESGKYAIEDIREWFQDWITKGAIYHVLHDQQGYTVCSGRVMTKKEAESDIARHQRLIDGGRYHGNITNPRMVDFREYPVPLSPSTLELLS